MPKLISIIAWNGQRSFSSCLFKATVCYKKVYCKIPLLRQQFSVLCPYVHCKISQTTRVRYVDIGFGLGLVHGVWEGQGVWKVFTPLCSKNVLFWLPLSPLFEGCACWKTLWGSLLQEFGVRTASKGLLLDGFACLKSRSSSAARWIWGSNYL